MKRGEYLKLIADRYALSNQELAELTPGLTAGSNNGRPKINVPTQDISVDEVAETKASSKSEKASASVSYKQKAIKYNVVILYRVLQLNQKLA